MLPFLAYIVVGQQNPTGLALPGTAKVADAVSLSAPSTARMGGLLGERYRVNEAARLLNVDEDELLAGFRHRPGKQSWIGEHVGKFLHAASLTYMAGRSPALKAKLDRVVSGLLATQVADGYLGTYPVGKRFGMAQDSEWDVWVHKYNLLGLLAYHQATQNGIALEGAKRVGDLLIKTFGPGGKSINSAGTHQGMAATSVLEPIVLLYRASKDPRYLQFARHIVEAYDEPNGPHIIKDLLRTGSVAQTANGKAYEMLSNLVGLAELYRETGEDRYLKPVRIAWNDIVKNRLYLTGTGSAREHWTADGFKPNRDRDNVGETCVSTTWIQLNTQLLRLTGDSKYVDQLERTVYNHLLGSQRADGQAWCYYSSLNGSRHPRTDINCCLSSGPRAIAMLPSFAYTTRKGGVDVNLYGPSTYAGALRLLQSTDYPNKGAVRVVVAAAPKTPTTLRLRIPGWAAKASVRLNGSRLPGVTPGRYFQILRMWKANDSVQLEFPMPLQKVEGRGSDAGRRAYTIGPLVLAADYAQTPGLPATSEVLLRSDQPKVIARGRYEMEALYEVDGYLAVRGRKPIVRKVVLVPFFLAGSTGLPYEVWMRTERTKRAASHAILRPRQSSSRDGNVVGSICDGDPQTTLNTYTGGMAQEDWFAIHGDAPVSVGRVVFHHGMSYHDGGWFDTSSGKPQVQVLREPGGAWETVGVLAGYPATTGAQNSGLVNGQQFVLEFAPRKVLGVRVIGKPAGGDRPEQAFVSCGELQAFPK